MATLNSISPQFLVADLSNAIQYYCEQLRFEVNIRYEDFYASVRRDNAEIHLKVAEQLPGERAHRETHDHIDAYIWVNDFETFYTEVKASAVTIIRDRQTQAWGVTDFYIRDPDGYIICFGKAEE